jgi:transcriptional regulator with PAS, ATPase and Fis domain
MRGFVGSSSAVARLAAYLPKVANSDANVLITGETGTGKEWLAEAVHDLGPRRAEPMISINCAAIPDALVESELFGYERGAFTGAQVSHPGKLRLAGAGTVFLDEISEMSLFAQAKLLRAVESRSIYPLGGTRPSPVRARFVAATNQELELLVAQGRFRTDLYYRLNVARLQMPPLRDRKEDVLGFFDFFVNEFNRRHGMHVGGASSDLQRVLLAYPWPGNVRELRNLVEAIFIDPPPRDIGLDALPEAFRRVFGGYVRAAVNERERLLLMLRSNNWNKSRVAAELKWSRMTLYRKLSKYGIDGDRLAER